tara:strand:+ start:3744 stop:3899 length:156 start_codon:yes stop_codon:yes gene_type:complete
MDSIVSAMARGVLFGASIGLVNVSLKLLFGLQSGPIDAAIDAGQRISGGAL